MTRGSLGALHHRVRRPSRRMWRAVARGNPVVSRSRRRPAEVQADPGPPYSGLADPGTFWQVRVDHQPAWRAAPPLFWRSTLRLSVMRPQRHNIVVTRGTNRIASFSSSLGPVVVALGRAMSPLGEGEGRTIWV